MFKEINLPQSIKLNMNSYIKVVRVDSLNNIVSFKSKLDNTIEFYAKNTKILYLYLSDFELLKTIDNLKYNKLNVVFDINKKNIMLLKDYKNILQNFNLKAILDSAVKQNEIVDVVKLLSKLGIKSEITYDLFKSIDKEEMQDILKNIVFNKEIIKNIEPFFSFVSYIYEKNSNKPIKQSLWSVFKDELDKFSYITKDGYVSISKRWDKRSRYLFNLDEGSSKQFDSELYKELSSYEQNLFFKNLECAMCEVFEFCGAYLKFEDGDFDCMPFRDILENIDKDFDIFKINDKKVA